MESITILNVVIYFMALWRVSNLIANEDGPYSVFARARMYAKGLERRYKVLDCLHLHEMLECEYCNSIWIGSAMVVLWLVLGEAVLLAYLALAGSTATILIKVVREKLMEGG